MRLQLLFDPNGILIEKSNTYNKVVKEIRGTTLDKHYFILPQEEEYAIRQRMLSNENCKLTVKYQVMDIDGQPQCMTQQVLP